MVAAKGPSGLWVGRADGEEMPPQQACSGGEDEKVPGKSKKQILQEVFRAMESERVCSEE